MNDVDLISLLGHSRRTDQALLTRFMIESNAIEGKTGLNPNDLSAAVRFLARRMMETSLLECHASLAKHLDVDWAGKWRTSNVRVGEYFAPDHAAVPELMRGYFRRLKEMDAYEAHCTFEKIHPFRDLNGRTGRLIWLHKAIDEGYTGRIGFL